MSNKRIKKVSFSKDQAPNPNAKSNVLTTPLHSQAKLKLDPSPEPHPRFAKDKS